MTYRTGPDDLAFRQSGAEIGHHATASASGLHIPRTEVAHIVPGSNIYHPGVQVENLFRLTESLLGKYMTPMT